jgi:CheY-like chemotaxis protein
MISRLWVAPGVGTSLTRLAPADGPLHNEPHLRMIIEQFPAVLWMTDRELCFTSSLGYTVTEAESGKEGLALLRRQPHDLIVVDMIMPDGIDGADTCQSAFEINPDQLAILISGYAGSARVQEALRRGAGAFVRRPLTLNSITLAVRRELEREVKAAVKV